MLWIAASRPVFPPLASFISQLTSSSECIQYSVYSPATMSKMFFLHPLCRPSRSYRTTPSCLQPAASPPSWERLCPRSASSSTESTLISENTLWSISTSHVIYLHTTLWGAQILVYLFVGEKHWPLSMRTWSTCSVCSLIVCRIQADSLHRCPPCWTISTARWFPLM